MAKSRLGLWCRTVLGAVAVFATLPLAGLIWILGLIKRLFSSWRTAIPAAVIVVILAGYGFWLFGSKGRATDTVFVEIRSGMGFHRLTDTLAELGVIRSPLLFRLSGRLSGIDRSLHVGLYSFEPKQSPYTILRHLASHEQIYRRFTVVEGALIRELLPRLASELDIPLDSLRFEVRRPDRLAQMGARTDDLEGYLFPETYTVPWGATAADVVDVMLAQFDTVWNRVSRDYRGSMTRQQAVTLASLIEAEARDGNERGLISSVFHNRLKRRMRLQCDPTVIYAMGGLDRPLMRKDWEYESPYNTYLISGLPPGPICSPGEASLRAALYPDSTSYLYFMARGDGTHKFSKTLAEHEAAYREVKRSNH